MAYANTPNKTVIRQIWDLPLIKCWRDRVGNQLAYFGLSGPQVHDLRDWHPQLKYCTCVESPGRTKKQRDEADETIGTFNTNVHLHGLSAMTQLLVADVEDVILEGTDKFGLRPVFADSNPAHRMRFNYDLINLDFDGGLGYRDGHGAAKRISALKKLFERQEGHNFLLLLTINVRDTLSEEIQGYLTDLRALDRGHQWRESLDWYISRGDGERAYKLKAAVPSFIRAISEPHAFQCFCRPPISYEGHKRAHMMHFIFELTSVQRNLPGVSPQDDAALLDLPLLTVHDANLHFAHIQHDGLTAEACVSSISFLTANCRSRVLATIPHLTASRENQHE